MIPIVKEDTAYQPRKKKVAEILDQKNFFNARFTVLSSDKNNMGYNPAQDLLCRIWKKQYPPISSQFCETKFTLGNYNFARGA